MAFEIVDTGIGIQPSIAIACFSRSCRPTHRSRATTAARAGVGDLPPTGFAAGWRSDGIQPARLRQHLYGSRSKQVACKASHALVRDCSNRSTRKRVRKGHSPRSSVQPWSWDDRREVRYLAQHFIEEAGGTVIVCAKWRGSDRLCAIPGSGQP